MNAPTPPSAVDDPEFGGMLDRRRGFLAKLAALLLGAVACVVPAAAGVAAFLNPLRQKGRAGRSLRIASLETLPEDGTPRRFPVVMDRTDAWNRYPNEPVGAVFLRRLQDGRVKALNVVCPHNGCFVGYDPEKRIFVCPCHKDTFDLSGKRLKEGSLSLRDLDELDVDQAKLADGEVWVKFQNFRTNTAEKVPQA